MVWLLEWLPYSRMWVAKFQFLSTENEGGRETIEIERREEEIERREEEIEEEWKRLWEKRKRLREER